MKKNDMQYIIHLFTNSKDERWTENICTLYSKNFLYIRTQKRFVMTSINFKLL